MRVRTALAAAAVSLSLGLVAVPAAEAANGTTAAPNANSVPALVKVPVSGVAKNGRKFNGTYAIQRFVVRNNKAVAVGTLTGTFKGRHVTRYGVTTPVQSLTGASGQTGTARAAQAASSCSVLHLVLGPISLNLLGLQVNLGGGTGANKVITLDITAIPGPNNLLGNLLCNLTGALSNTGALSALTSNLNQLTTALNSLVGLLGGLGL